METTRFNVFNQIHKALRALMFDTALLIQQTDLAAAEQSESILIQTEILLELMDQHAHHEDNFILAAALKHAPDVIAAFEEEHVTDLHLTTQLREAIAVYRQAASNEERLNYGIKISQALNEFIAFNLTHMQKEETLLNEVLWTNFSDAEIQGMEAGIQQQIRPDQLFIYFKWMVKAINNTELLHWLNAVKQEAPDFIFSGLWQICEENLAPERKLWLQQQMTEGELVNR